MLKSMADSGMMSLRRDHADWRGNDPESDGATAYDNIRDACDGKPALRYISYQICLTLNIGNFDCFLATVLVNPMYSS